MLITVLPVLSQADSELPLHKKSLSEKLLVVWVGDHFQTSGVVALSTSQGLVVIETNLSRTNDIRIRSVIEEEFGRKDFKYLINTHYHHDHTAGNQVYSDVIIIGHKNIPAGMKKELEGEGLTSLVVRPPDLGKGWEEEMRKAEPQSDKYNYFREGVTLLQMTIKGFQNRFIPEYSEGTE